MRSRWWVSLLALVGASFVAAPAHAAVRGRRGLEIEGAQDRRGFFVAGGVAFGATFFDVAQAVPATRVDLVLGGGVTERFTLGVDLHVTPYLRRGAGVSLGGDVEGTGYLWQGLFLRAAAGVAGVPVRETDDASPMDEPRDFTVGIGGAVGLGYEFFLNATAAMSVAATYDVRLVPGHAWPWQTALVGVRFAWF